MKLLLIYLLAILKELTTFGFASPSVVLHTVVGLASAIVFAGLLTMGGDRALYGLCLFGSWFCLV
jgi:hypothetical protein